MLTFIDVFVRFICYAGFIFGAWRLFSPFILPSVKNALNVSRFRKEKQVEIERQRNKIYAHLELVLSVVLGKKYKNAVYTFLAVSGIMVLAIFIILFNRQSIQYVLLFSVIVGALPYVVLRVRLISIRIDGSYEAEPLVSEITNQYKIKEMNMLDALDQATINLRKLKYSSRALFTMCIALKEYKTDKELARIITEFVYAFDTEWAVLLGMNIQEAISKGTDVRPSLDDVVTNLKIIRTTLEDEKKYNHESFSMIRFVIPFVYVFTAFFAIKFFGFTLKRFLAYQFQTSIGLKMAIVLFTSMIVNFVVLQLTKKPKYDN